MTLDALVTTVEAIECVRLGSRLRPDGSLFSGGFQVSLRLRGFIQQNHKQNTAASIAATPPMTPPTIGPTGVDCLASMVWPGNCPILTQVIEAHWSQDCGIREHVSSDLHVGQPGLSLGSHSTHLRYKVLRTSRAAFFVSPSR